MPFVRRIYAIRAVDYGIVAEGRNDGLSGQERFRTARAVGVGNPWRIENAEAPGRRNAT